MRRGRFARCLPAIPVPEPELGSADADLYACPSFDDRVNIHTDSQGAPVITHVLPVCPPVKFLGGLFGEMNGAKVLKDVSEFSKQNLHRLARQQLGPVGKVSGEEVRGGRKKGRCRFLPVN